MQIEILKNLFSKYYFQQTFYAMTLSKYKHCLILNINYRFVRNQDILAGIALMASKPSKLQVEALQMLLLESKDAILFNGYGKTFAVAIAMIQHVDSTKEHPQVLCICTTREAAIQTHEMVEHLAWYTGVTVGLAVKDQSKKHSIDYF